MPYHNTEFERKLEKLGQRVRAGFAKEHPTTDRELTPVRDAIREQWELERAIRGQQGVEPEPGRKPSRDGPEPEP